MKKKSSFLYTTVTLLLLAIFLAATFAKTEDTGLVETQSGSRSDSEDVVRLEERLRNVEGLSDLLPTEEEKAKLSSCEVEEWLNSIAEGHKMELEEKERLGTMQRILYDLPEPDPKLPGKEERKEMDPEEYKALLERVWDARQKEITEAMEKMDDEAQVILHLTGNLVEFNASSDINGLLETMEKIEFHVMELEKARYFASLGGIHACIKFILQHENSSVRAMAAHVLGTTVKNVPDLQDIAFEAGVLEGVLGQIEIDLDGCLSISGDSDRAEECSKMLFALSSQARGHEHSQEKLIEQGFLQALTNLAGIPNLEPRVMLKVSSLAHDSFVEWPNCPAHWAVNETKRDLCENLTQRLNELSETKISGNTKALHNSLKSTLGVVCSIAHDEL